MGIAVGSGTGTGSGISMGTCVGTDSYCPKYEYGSGTVQVPVRDTIKGAVCCTEWELVQVPLWYRY